MKAVLAVAFLAVASLSSAQVTRTDRLAVFIVQFADSSSALSDTMTRARSLADQGQNYYTEVSYGKYLVQADVLGLYTLPIGSNATRVDIRRESFAAAEAAGVDLSIYTKWCFIAPATPNANGGWGDMSGAYIGVVGGIVIIPTAHIFLHELGHHLLTLDHAHGSQCYTDPNGITTCDANAPYGDNLDVMGVGETGHFNAITKAGLGWLTITPVTGSGDYLITPLETPSSGTKALSFTIGRRRSALGLVLQYRQSIGFDTINGVSAGKPDPANVFAGVEFHMQLNGSMQMEMNAYDPATEIYHPALTVGQTYCDKEGSISATVVSATATGAVVRMDTKARCQ